MTTHSPELCGEILLTKPGEVRGSRCQNRATHGGRCAMHAPDLRAARYATREAKRLAALRSAPPTLQERLVKVTAERDALREALKAARFTIATHLEVFRAMADPEHCLHRDSLHGFAWADLRATALAADTAARAVLEAPREGSCDGCNDTGLIEERCYCYCPRGQTLRARASLSPSERPAPEAA